MQGKRMYRLLEVRPHEKQPEEGNGRITFKLILGT